MDFLNRLLLSSVSILIIIWSSYFITPSNSCYSASQSLDLEISDNLEDEDVSSFESSHQHFDTLTRFKRGLDEVMFHGQNGSSKPYFLKIHIATDVGLYNKFEEDEDKLVRRVRAIIRNVNALYLALHVHVVIVGMDVWKSTDKISISSNSDEVLPKLSSYRSTILKDTDHDATILYTNVDFDGDTVGKALVGTMCERNLSVAVVQMTSDAATVTAHEIGHLLGMKHDEDGEDCECPTSHCIMAEQSKNSPDHGEGWSTCSVNYLKDYIKTGLFYCLDEKPKTILKPPLCGDGLVQGSEECDCGPPSFCDNPCCDPQTCRLAPNATCANGLCCDTKTCDYREEHTVCRKSSSDCDLPEYCSGDSAICPEDIFKWNGLPCESDFSGHCWDGLCRSRKQSCANKFGKESKVARNVCYKHMGITDQCVKDYKNGEPACSQVCGRLVCETDKPNKHVLRGYGTQTINGIICYNIRRDDKSDLVDDGSPCGEGKLCLNEKCVTVPDIAYDCETGCDNHGVCNSKGHCHCDPGYAPPDCRSPGPGGSIDSNRGTHKPDNFKTIVLLLFLVAVPLFVIFWCLVMNSNLWWRNKGHFWTRSWSPGCAKCLDSCCCPIMGIVGEKMAIPIPKPGTRIVVEKIESRSKRNNVVKSSSEEKIMVSNQDSNVRKSGFLTDSPIPNVRFHPIDEQPNFNGSTVPPYASEPRLNRVINNDEIRKKHFSFAFDSPVPNVRFTPIDSNSSHTSTNSDLPNTHTSQNNGNRHIASANNINSLENSNTAYSPSGRNNNIGPSHPNLKPTRRAPVLPKIIPKSSNMGNQNTSKLMDQTVKELSEKFNK